VLAVQARKLAPVKRDRDPDEPGKALPAGGLFQSGFAKRQEELLAEKLREGERRKEVGLARVSGDHSDWVNRARALAAVIAGEEGDVTTDDIQARLSLPEDAHPNLWGSVLRAPMFRRVGYKKSTRAEAHARVIGIWRLP